MMSSGQETHKTRAKEDLHHQTTLYRSSYASQMRMLENIASPTLQQGKTKINILQGRSRI
jgi:hypothetical protein